MNKSKAFFWFALWGACFAFAFAFGFPELLLLFGRTIRTGELIFSLYQLILSLVYIPFVLLPLLIVALCRALKEGNKTIKIVSICLLVVHVALMAVALSSFVVG